jgi:hypothetical protein
LGYTYFLEWGYEDLPLRKVLPGLPKIEVFEMVVWVVGKANVLVLNPTESYCLLKAGLAQMNHENAYGKKVRSVAVRK